jgi:hypothetical protein
VCCDRTVALKGGRFQSWNGSHDLKRLVTSFVCFILLCFGTSTKDPIQSLDWFYLSFTLLYSSLLWNFNKRPNPISRLVLSLFLLLPPVFIRLDVFYGSSIDYMQNPFSRSKCFPLIRLDLALHIVPWIRYLGFTNRGKKGPLTTTGDLSACKST